MHPNDERGLRRDLQYARATRPQDVPLILAELGESVTPTNRGGASAERGAAKPKPAKSKPAKASAGE